MTQLPPEAADPIVRRLRTLAQDSPDLRDAAQVYEIILPLLQGADLHVTPIALTPDQARTKLEMRLPLLHGLSLELDTKAACGLMLQLARALETVSDMNWPRQRGGAALHETVPEGGDVLSRAKAARQLRLALEDDKLNLATLLPHVAAGNSEFAATLAQTLQLDPGLVWTLAQDVLKPALRTWCRQLAPIAEGIAWHTGYCYICSAGATLGELQDDTQIKHLRCGQCGADWQFPRLQCMYCGNRDHNTLSYLYTESRLDKMHIEVCNQCHGYLKVIAAFSPTPPDLLAVEDLATLHLDYIAQARGYARVEIEYPYFDSG